MSGSWSTPISFQSLLTSYSSLQTKVAKAIKSLAASTDKSDPGQFLLVQFMMSQVTQVGDSISNLMYQVNSMISHSISNQKV